MCSNRAYWNSGSEFPACRIQSRSKLGEGGKRSGPCSRAGHHRDRRRGLSEWCSDQRGQQVSILCALTKQTEQRCNSVFQCASTSTGALALQGHLPLYRDSPASLVEQRQFLL